MSGQQLAMIVAGSLVIVACVGWIATSHQLPRAVWEASWGRLRVPHRPRMVRFGLIGAGAFGIVLGAGVIVLALTVAPR
jgi:hypothetical protein